MKFKVKEDGKNGTVEVADQGVTYTDKKLIGRDNVTWYKYNRIEYVTLISRMIGSDIAEISVGGTVCQWKTSNAKKLVAMINERTA